MGGYIFYGMTPIESMHSGSGGSTHLDTALSAQLIHAGHPDIGNSVFFTQRRQGFCDCGIGILGQKYLTGTAALQRLSQLLGAYDHLSVGIPDRTSIRRIVQFMRFHTSLYYTHIFQKVNLFSKFFRKTPDRTIIARSGGFTRQIIGTGQPGFAGLTSVKFPALLQKLGPVAQEFISFSAVAAAGAQLTQMLYK